MRVLEEMINDKNVFGVFVVLEWLLLTKLLGL